MYLATDNEDAIETLVSLCASLTFYYRTDVDREFLVVHFKKNKSLVTADDIEKQEIFLEQRLFRYCSSMRIRVW